VTNSNIGSSRICVSLVSFVVIAVAVAFILELKHCLFYCSLRGVSNHSCKSCYLTPIFFYIYMKQNFIFYLFAESPRHTLVVFLSGVAGATVFLLLFLLGFRLCKKQRKKKKFSMKNKKRDEEDEGNKIKSVTIELQGSDDETKEINVNPGDIIIIDHNDVDRAGSEDLGYLSEIVRFYNSQNIGSDDQISIRKQFSICDSPSVISTEASESRDSKHDSVGMKQCSCQHGSLLRPSSPLGVI